MNNIDDINIAFPEIFLLGATFVLLLMGLFRKDPNIALVYKASIGLLLLCLAVLFGYGSYFYGAAFFDSFIHNQYSFFFKAFVTIGAIGVLAISLPYLRIANMAQFEYPVLTMLALLGMYIMISANSLLVMYMGLELQSLSLYILAASQRNNVRSSEAGLKYFVLGALSSGFLLFGMSLIYGYTGNLNFTLIHEALQSSTNVPDGAIVGLIFILAAMAFKVTAAPFHIWAPDVYEGAPTSVTAFFSIVPKVAAFALLIKLLVVPFAPIVTDWQPIIYIISLLSMLIGAFAALTQNNIKRLLAFSSIGNMGYALIGLATGISAEGLSATIVYLVIYAITTLGVFGLILMFNKDNKIIENIDDLAGLAKTNPFKSYMMAIFMFSYAGIPPFAGFFAKLYIFQAAIEADMIILAVLGILTSVVAAYYYLRIVKVMFFDEGEVELVADGSLGKPLVVGICAITILFYIFSPDSLLHAVQQTVGLLIMNV